MLWCFTGNFWLFWDSLGGLLFIGERDLSWMSVMMFEALTSFTGVSFFEMVSYFLNYSISNSFIFISSFCFLIFLWLSSTSFCSSSTTLWSSFSQTYKVQRLSGSDFSNSLISSSYFTRMSSSLLLFKNFSLIYRFLVSGTGCKLASTLYKLILTMILFSIGSINWPLFNSSILHLKSSISVSWRSIVVTISWFFGDLFCGAG